MDRNMSLKLKGNYYAELLDKFRWPKDECPDDCYEALRTAQYLLFHLQEIDECFKQIGSDLKELEQGRGKF